MRRDVAGVDLRHFVVGVAEEASTGDAMLASWNPTSVEVGHSKLYGRSPTFMKRMNVFSPEEKSWLILIGG